ncbi:MAG: XisH family protein [Byssovorax sp.]
MPARDLYHDEIRSALEADGWTITHDPYVIPVGLGRVFVDLGAERLLAASRGTERIAVEVKSFLGRSAIADLEQALGQYLLYRPLLSRHEPDRTLFLAVPLSTHEEAFGSTAGQIAVETYEIRLMVVDTDNRRIERWRR